jgi:uncharacterized protein involved in outer membrane biogenesis
LGCGALGLVGLLVVCALALTLMDWNRLRGPVGRLASAHLHRQVTLAGPLQVHVWSRTPTVSISDLQVGNPPWETRDRFLSIEHLQIQLDLHGLLRGHIVLRRVALVHPDIYLHREKSGRANWTFENTAPNNDLAPAPVRLPAIQDAIIELGTLTMIDDLRRLNLTGSIEAREEVDQGDGKPLHIAGRGTLNDEPFQLDLSGGALLAISPDHPYAFTLSMRAGQQDIEVQGAVLRPFDFGGLDLQVDARGRDLADLYYLTQIGLPNTPPYRVQAHIARTGQRFNIRDIKGLLGTTDIGGTVDVDVSHKRPAIVAKVISRHMFLKDMGAITGSRLGANTTVDAKTTADSPAGSSTAKSEAARLFPVAHLQVNRVQGMDADVTFTANAVTAGAVPITDVNATLTVKDGVLTVHPVRLNMPQGRLSGLVSIDTRLRPPKVLLDMQATDVQLEQIKGRAPNATAPLGGIFEARAIIAGRGDSVHDLMASANGTVTGVIPHGDIRAAFAELTGVDVAKGVGLLFKKPDDRATIRCGLAQFDVQRGTARADSILMDTQNVLITGGGQIDLGDEKLDLSIEGHPKKPRLIRLRTPVRIKGHVLKPTVALETGHLIKQGGIAAALGTVLAPLAAVLAFVDPGLAKDQNCAQLGSAQQQKSVLGGKPPPQTRGAPAQLANSAPRP